MAEQAKRSCAGCGAPTTAIVIERPRINAAGRKVGTKKVEFGGRECEECIAKRERDELEQLTAEKLDNYRQFARVPQRYRGADFTGFTAQEAVEAAKAWAEGKLKALCLFGDAGRGKTWLAAAALRSMIARRAREDAELDLDESHEELRGKFRPVRWVSVSGLMADLDRSFNDEERAKAVKIVAGSGAVVLDDLDKVNPTERGKGIIFSTIDARLSAGSPLLVTTNLAPAQLGQKLGKPVMSRIAGDCMVIEMVGPDRRMRPVEQQVAQAV